MFKWYFQFYYVENSFLFWFSSVLIVAIIYVTIHFVRKVLKDNYANK